MDSGVIMKKTKIELLVNLIIGFILLTTGILMTLFDIELFDNNKVIIALSFIPFGYAVSSLLKIILIKKSPSKYVSEYDERLVTARNRADAVSLRIIRYLLFLVFLGYSFTNSHEIFETFNWWLLLAITLLTIFLPAIILGNVNKKYKPDNTE